jgi:hypothetical protein
MTQEAPQHQPHHYAVDRRRRRTKFWAIAVVLCLIGTLLSIGIRFLYDSVGRARPLRYEPVDVPPRETSPRHEPENQELERRSKEKNGASGSR